MLISDTMCAALNQQIGHEFGASLQYVALAAHFDRLTLPMLAAHYYRQADEERSHALRFVHYIVETGGRVEVPAVPAPKSRFDTAEEAAKAALDHEMGVTKQIAALVDLAVKEQDRIAENMLQWFLSEQLEEVHSARSLLSVVQRAGEDGLLQVEDYLARRRERSASAPAPESNG